MTAQDTVDAYHPLRTSSRRYTVVYQCSPSQQAAGCWVLCVGQKSRPVFPGKKNRTTLHLMSGLTDNHKVRTNGEMLSQRPGGTVRVESLTTKKFNDPLISAC